MTEANSRPIRYLTKQDISAIHAKLAASVAFDGDEPLPAFRYAKHDDIDALVAAVQQRFYDRDAYPSLEEKAAIIFYTVNRRHMFPNGNKRMSALCLLTFLLINEAALDVRSEQLTEKALWLATVEALDFPAIKAELVSWIAEHLVPLDIS